MSRSSSRKALAKSINKCKSRAAKMLHKRAKTPAQRRKVLSKAAKRCTKKKVLSRKSKPRVMGRFTPVLAEDAEMIYPAEFIIRHIYPPEYEKPDFEMMDKVPEKSDSIHRIANRFIELYSICDECMITRFELENQETGNSTVYIFEPSDPKTPETGRFFVDIHVEKIPEEFNDKVSQMITDVRNADCSTLQTVSDERNKELLEVSNNQRISQPFVRDVYEGIRKAESIRQEECSALMPDM